MGFPSGQRGRTVNPLTESSKVRILLPPPFYFYRDSEEKFPASAEQTCGSGSVVEHRLAKARVASSNLVFRSSLELWIDNLEVFYLIIDQMCLHMVEEIKV